MQGNPLGLPSPAPLSGTRLNHKPKINPAPSGRHIPRRKIDNAKAQRREDAKNELYPPCALASLRLCVDSVADDATPTEALFVLELSFYKDASPDGLLENVRVFRLVRGSLNEPLREQSLTFASRALSFRHELQRCF